MSFVHCASAAQPLLHNRCCTTAAAQPLLHNRCCTTAAAQPLLHTRCCTPATAPASFRPILSSDAHLMLPLQSNIVPLHIIVLQRRAGSERLTAALAETEFSFRAAVATAVSTAGS
jgi:hypothetical protein